MFGDTGLALEGLMTTYAEFCAAFHTHFTADANARVVMGIDVRLGELPDPSLAGLDAAVESARGLLAGIGSIDTAALTFHESLDLDLARLALERQIHDATYTFNGRRAICQKPTAGDDIGDGIFLMFANDPRPDAARLSDITARLEAVPSYLAALQSRLDTPVLRWLSIDREKVEGLPGLLQNIEDWAVRTDFAALERLRAARAVAESATGDYLAWLAELPTTTHFHLNEQTARRIVHLRGIGVSLEEIHGYACRFLADTSETLSALRDRLVPRYGLPEETTVEQLHAFLNEKFAVKVVDGNLDSILDRYQAEREKILDFIKERDLFPVFEAQDMKIIRTPGFMEPSIPAGAMMSPPPFRDGIATSLVYLTLSEALLDEHTELGIPGMMIHEGIPGHHLQLATASRHPSTIRRHTDAMEHAEGWTTMLEDYMLDVGYMGELTDEARFIGKRDISRIGARVAIDLFFMTGDRRYLDVGVDCDTSAVDPFEAAGALLSAVTGFTPGRTQAELNWYSQERGYPLSYLTGNVLVWSLKRDIEAANPQMDSVERDRAFHRIYLQSGNMPVRFLRRIFAHEGMLS